MPVIGCLEIFQNGRSPQPITGIIYSPGCHELKIGSAAEILLALFRLSILVSKGNFNTVYQQSENSIIGNDSGTI